MPPPPELSAAPDGTQHRQRDMQQQESRARTAYTPPNNATLLSSANDTRSRLKLMNSDD